VVRARSFIIGNGRWSLLPRFQLQIHIEVGIRGLQFPPFRRLPMGEISKSIGGAFDAVFT